MGVHLPMPGENNDDPVALLLDGCCIDDALRDAVLQRNKRDVADLGDTEPGQHLWYPRSPTLGSSEEYSPFSSPLTSPSPSPSPSPVPPLFPSADVTSLVLDGEASSAATAPTPFGNPKNHKKRGKAAKAAKARAAVRPSSYKIRLSLSTKYKNDRRMELPKLRMLTLKTVALGA